MTHSLRVSKDWYLSLCLFSDCPDEGIAPSRNDQVNFPLQRQQFTHIFPTVHLTEMHRVHSTVGTNLTAHQCHSSCWSPRLEGLLDQTVQTLITVLGFTASLQQEAIPRGYGQASYLQRRHSE